MINAVSSYNIAPTFKAKSVNKIPQTQRIMKNMPNSLREMKSLKQFKKYIMKAVKDGVIDADYAGEILTKRSSFIF